MARNAKEKIETIIIPKGYRIEKVVEKMDISAAGSLLTTRRRHGYTSARREGDEAELTRHVFICPHCGNRTPAYPGYLHIQPVIPITNRCRVRRWSDSQLSLFPILRDERDLNLSNPIPGTATVRCPKCEEPSPPSLDCTDCTIITKKNSIEVKTPIESLEKLFTMGWATKTKLNLRLPFAESAVFNFGKGRVYLKIEDSDGKLIAIRDITDHPEHWSDGPLYELLFGNKTVKRRFRKAFEACYGAELPYNSAESDIFKYVVMTRFHGYSRNFFTSIPFVCGSCEIDRSFAGTEKKLRASSKVVKAVAESSLPKAKTVRKLFYSNPGLLFYLPECEWLYTAIADVNLYRKLLESGEIYELLQQIHLYPGIKPFYSDYVAVKGASSLVKHLIENLMELNFTAVRYASLSEPMKKCERRAWKTEGPILPDDGEYDRREYLDLQMPRSFLSNRYYSFPISAPDARIEACRLKEFVFRPLESYNDYYSTGTGLHNCLRSWNRMCNPVVGVFVDGRPEAAIEINPEHRRVVQALGEGNVIIETESRLGKALNEWIKRNALEWNTTTFNPNELMFDDLFLQHT